MFLAALSSLCGLMVSCETSTRATKQASQTFPGVLMGVTLPAALVHLSWLTSQCVIYSNETEMLSCTTQAFKIAHTKEKAALPFVVCFLWILFNPKFYSMEITAVVSALIVFIVFILNLNVRWVLMQTITAHAVNNAFSHAVASDNLNFELLLLQNALGIMFDEILMLNSAPAPVILKIVCIGTSYTIIYGAVMTNVLRSIPKSTGVGYQIQIGFGVALSFLLFVVILLYSITHLLGRSAVLWIADILFQDSGLRFFICLGWCCCIYIAVIFAFNAITKWHWSIITSRKIFHALAVIIFIPPLLFCSKCAEFVALAFGVALCVFLVLELLRLFVATNDTPLFLDEAFSYLNIFMKEDRRNETKGCLLIMDHITLLVACALPVWVALAATPRLDTTEHKVMPLLPFLGCLSVGVGDAMGAFIGINFGRRKWSSISGRTVEGSIAAFLSMVLAGIIINILLEGSINNRECVSGLLTATFVTVIESSTSYNDNLVLTIFSIAIYQSLNLVFALSF